MTSFRCALALLACLIGAARAAEPQTKPALDRPAVARRLWDQALARTGGKPVASDAYPTEPALPFLSAYVWTRQPRYAQQAARQLQAAHARETNGILITAAGTTTRDYQARQIYNFYLAYRVLADGKYLKWADACAQAMLKTIPRGAHRSAGDGKTYMLFSAGFVDPAHPAVGSLQYMIDVNQNAEVALAYSLLYFDPGSSFFHDSKAREVAEQETLASMSIQNMATGAIALTDAAEITQYDTAYAGYGVFSWTWLQLLWHDSRFEPHLQAAAKWLGPKTDLAHGSDRYYPHRNPGGYMPYWETDYKIPLLWYAGVDEHHFIADLFARREHGGDKGDDQALTGAAPWTWAYYDLMGVPRSYYVDGLVDPSRAVK
jgi:hypothetical protein